MIMTRLAVLALRILLAIAFALSLVFQFFSLPGQFAHMAEENPEVAFLRWPLTAFWGVELLCFQVVVVSTWKLLTMVKQDRIFSEASLRWVDAIVWAFAAAWVLLAGVAATITAFIFFTPELRDPGTPMVLFAITLVGAVVVLLVVVLRALLRQATALRTDLEGVV
jgi:hypothetical protein